MTREEEWRDPEIQRLLADVKASIDAYLHKKQSKIALPTVAPHPDRIQVEGVVGTGSARTIRTCDSGEGLIVARPLELWEEPAA